MIFFLAEKTNPDNLTIVEGTVLPTNNNNNKRKTKTYGTWNRRTLGYGGLHRRH